MSPEEFKTKIINLCVRREGKSVEKDIAVILKVSIRDLKRFKKGKLPPRYRRDEIFSKVKRMWVHYEGREDERPEVCVSKE